MNLKKLKEKRQLLIGELDNMVSSLEKDGEVRSLTVEEREAFNSKKAEIESIDATISLVEETRAKEIGESAVVELRETREKDEIEKRALENFFRGNELIGEERAILASTNTAIMPVEISKTIMQKLEEQCPILEKATRFSSKGTLKLIKESSIDEADITAENTAFPDKDVTFETIDLASYKVATQVHATFEMLKNIELNLTSYLLDVITRRLAKKLNKLFLLGTGTDQPQGLIKQGKTHEIADSDLTINDFITMQTSIHPSYLNDCVWIVGRKVFTAMANMLDKNGRPYLVANYDQVNNKIAYTFLGLQVVVDENMSSFKQNDIIVVMANIREAYAVNMLQDIVTRHLTEVGFTSGYEVFAGYCMADGKIINPEAIALGKYTGTTKPVAAKAK